MDDVQDDLFFRHWVESSGLPFAVLPFRNKFVGVAGRGLRDFFNPSAGPASRPGHLRRA